jgi:hypothetical protein
MEPARHTVLGAKLANNESNGQKESRLLLGYKQAAPKIQVD